MEKLEKRIAKFNKENDKKKEQSMTIAEKVVASEHKQQNTFAMKYFKSTPEEREAHNHMAYRYGKYLEIDDPSKIGCVVKEKKSNGIIDTILYTDMGPIIKSETKEGIRYEGFCASEDFNTDTKHYYYARVYYGPVSDRKNAKIETSGYFREDNGVFHDVNSERARQLSVFALKSLMNRFETLSLNATRIMGDTIEPVGLKQQGISYDVDKFDYFM